MMKIIFSDISWNWLVNFCKFTFQHRAAQLMKCWSVLNVSVIIFFYLFYYRIGCYWMWLRIRRYSVLFPAWCAVAWLFSKSVFVWTDACIDSWQATWQFGHSNIFTVWHFSGHIYWTTVWPWISVVVKTRNMWVLFHVILNSFCVLVCVCV